jgi:hypothetical protein
MIVISSVGISYGLAISSTADLTEEQQVAILKVGSSHPELLTNSTLFTWGIRYTLPCGLSKSPQSRFTVVSHGVNIIVEPTKELLISPLEFLDSVSPKSFFTKRLTVFRLYFLSNFVLRQRRIWDPADQCTGGATTQYTRTKYLLTNTIVDVSTDLICMILPFFILRKLHLDVRKKIALGVYPASSN